MLVRQAVESCFPFEVIYRQANQTLLPPDKPHFDMDAIPGRSYFRSKLWTANSLDANEGKLALFHQGVSSVEFCFSLSLSLDHFRRRFFLVL